MWQNHRRMVCGPLVSKVLPTSGSPLSAFSHTFAVVQMDTLLIKLGIYSIDITDYANEMQALKRRMW